MELSELSKSRNTENNLSFNLDNLKNYTAIIVGFIFGFIFLIIQIYSCIHYRNYISANWLFIIVLVLIVYFTITMISLFRTRKLEKAIKELEIEKINYKSLSNLYDNVRCIKHDFNNIIHNIGAYISLDDFEALKSYYKGLSAESLKIKNLSFLNNEYIKDPTILCLLSQKYYEANTLGINVNINTFSTLENLSIDSFNLARILDILLDNAIIASSKCADKIINIELNTDRRLDRNLIIIENTYTNKDVNLDEIFNKGYSSKTKEVSENHGLGLWKVKQILNKNKNLNLYTTKNDKYFRQQVEIYN